MPAGGARPAPRLETFLVAACVAVAALRMITGVVPHASRPKGMGDFSCYYYAGRVAAAGLDPYDVRALDALATMEIGRAVNPYFYPPPFLLLAWPFAALPVAAARLAWLALEAAAVVAGFVLLARLLAEVLPGSARRAAPVAALIAALLPAVEDDLAMGQANGVVLLAILAGVRSLLRGRELAGGALLGLAASLKMSPAILLAWLALRRRWRALAAALAAFVLLTVATLPLAGRDVQGRFYGEVLPGFSRGFPGVKLRLDWFGNHSLPGAASALLPGSDPRMLSPGARALALVAEAALLVLAARSFRGREGEAWWECAGAAFFLGLMVAFPAFTFEHHLLYLTLPIGLAVLLAAEGRLSARLSLALAAGCGLLAIRPSDLASADMLRGAGEAAALLAAPARIAKLAGVGLVLLCLLASRGRPAPSPQETTA